MCFGVGICLYPGESENTGTSSAFKAAALLDHHQLLSHPDLFPSAVTRDSDKKAELSHVHRTQEYANYFHMSEMKIFSKTDIKAPHTHSQCVHYPMCSTQVTVCKPSLPVAIRWVLTDTTCPPWYREWTQHLSSDFCDFQLNFLFCWNMDHLLHHAYFCIINLLACWNHSWKPFSLGLQQ